MIISDQWLREWVNPDADAQVLAEQLTMAGLEVDSVGSVAGDFSGVVVAEVISAEQHPDADKLRVCQVNTGAETVQIVCGAPNARAGLKAPLARVGAVLPGEFKIKKAKLRGQESQGMLCAEQELGFSDEKQGLMELAADAPVGTCLREYLGLDDQVIELDLTPNRADCLSVRGIAREVALLNQSGVTEPAFDPVDVTLEETLEVTLEAPARCPRYLGRIIRGVDISRESPLWMQEKLRRCGLRSIDPVVDVTNYVLLELGQPMHAFDFDKLQGGITVREAKAGESLELLDGQTVELTPDVLVIADESGPVAMGGIMGGNPTAVAEGSSNIFLECAFFTPQHMAGKARDYGLQTDSSHRYERGVDFMLQHQAMERATQLLQEIVGGEVGPVFEALSREDLPVNPEVPLRRSRIPRILGIEIEDAEVERILQGLDIAYTTNDEGWVCAGPSWRFDIDQEADLLEEVARIHGYDNLPVSHVEATLRVQKGDEHQLKLRDLRRRLTGRGYREAITYSFIEPALQQRFDPGLEPVPVANPISADMAVMRTSLMPGLINALAYNTKRQQHRVRLFETGLRFVPGAGEDGLAQIPTLAMIICGNRDRESWSLKGESADFYDLKGDLESLLELTGEAQSFRFEAAERAALHPGQTARILRDGEAVGYIGTLHPQTVRELDLPEDVVVCEIDLAAVRAARVPAFRELSKFPEVRRDLAVLVDKELPAQAVLEDVRSAAGPYLTSLRLFDVYHGKGIDPKRKSLAMGLTFRDQSRTLSDEDVNQAIDQVVDLLAKNHDAELR